MVIMFYKQVCDLYFSYQSSPSPSNYKFKKDLDLEENDLDIFLPPGSLNGEGNEQHGMAWQPVDTGLLTCHLGIHMMIFGFF